LGKVPLYFIITICDEFAVVPPCVKALTQSEQMFRPVIPNQRLGDRFLAGFDATIAQAGELDRVSFSVENGFEDCDAAHSRNIADDMMQLQVHLVHRLLHALRIRTRGLHEAVAMAQ
jgi:hypothetical protein